MSELLTAVQRATRQTYLADPNVIPPITDPLGQRWKQPDRRLILVDDKHAVMSPATFLQLLDYTASQPTGMYEGKMWKARYGMTKLNPTDLYPTQGGTWYLCWAGVSDQLNCVSIKYREVLIV